MIRNIPFLNEFVDDFPIGIAIADTTNNNPNSYNKYFLDLFGWDKKDIDTLEQWFLNAYPNEEYRNKVVEEWEKLIEDTENKNLLYSPPMEVNVSCKDGSTKICECRYYRKENFIYGIFTDITKQKNIEEKLISITLCDELTQLGNRKSYNNEIHKLLSIYQRYETRFSIIMYDIDDFKLINDNFGHKVGDDVLVDMSKLIKSHLRDSDTIFRIGGEEFIILLPQTQIDEAKIVSEKVRLSVENDLKTIKDKTITISIGLTEVKEDDDEDSIFKRVDTFLYLSKRSGKNRISYTL